MSILQAKNTMFHNFLLYKCCCFFEKDTFIVVCLKAFHPPPPHILDASKGGTKQKVRKSIICKIKISFTHSYTHLFLGDKPYFHKKHANIEQKNSLNILRKNKLNFYNLQQNLQLCLELFCLFYISTIYLRNL
jgi:hypothetical protein